MAKKSIKKNYIYNLIYKILSLITPFMTAPYVARVLGADGVGTASYTESIVAYFILFAALGLDIFGQREISYVQDSLEKRTVIFWETVVFKCTTSAIAIFVYIIFAINQSQSELYLVLALSIVSTATDVTWFFQGIEEFGKIVLRNIIFKVLHIAYIFAVIRTKNDLIWYLLGTSGFGVLSNISLWPYLRRYISKPCFKNLKPQRHIKTVISLFIPTIAIQVYTVLDKTMIGAITHDAFENGYYEQAIKISKMVLVVVTSLGTVMIPRIGYHFERGETEKVRSYMYRGYKFVWFLGIPLCLGLMMVAGNFVPWFFGQEYEKVAPLIGILSLLILAIGISNVTGMQYLIPTKRQNVFTRTVIYGAVMNFAMNYFLIQKFQSYGAAVASVAAETLIAVVQIFIVRKELSPWEIIKSGWHYYVAGAIMAAVLFFVKGYFAATIINTLILVIIGATVYFSVLLVIRDQFFFDNVIFVGKKTMRKLKKSLADKV